MSPQILSREVAPVILRLIIVVEEIVHSAVVQSPQAVAGYGVSNVTVSAINRAPQCCFFCGPDMKFRLYFQMDI